MLAKSLALVFVTHCLLVISESQNLLLNELGVKCREENHLQKDEVAHLRETRHLEENDKNLKCFIKCILTGLKLMNEEGDFTLEDTPKGKKKYKKHFPTCKNVTGIDFCDKAWNFQNCLWKQIDAEEKSSQ